MKKIITCILLSTLLIGCSSTDTFSGTGEVVKNNILSVDCSAEVNNTQDDWGFHCQVQLTEDTVLVDESNAPITLDALKSKDELIEVEVTLTSSKNLMEESDELIAEKVKVISTN